MHLVKVGRYVLSFDDLIMVEHAGDQTQPDEPPPGCSRITMRPGRVIDLGRADTELLDRHLGSVLVPDPAASPPAPSSAVGTERDPSTGRSLQPRGKKRSQGR